MARKVLIGMHNQRWSDTFREAGELQGWNVAITNTLEVMLALMNSGTYSFYVMDANLGNRGSSSIAAAETVYALVRNYVETGNAKFLAITGGYDIVSSCLEKGIPAKDKGHVGILDDYFR